MAKRRAKTTKSTSNTPSERGPLRSARPEAPEPDLHVYRPDRPGIRKVLGNLEAEIMEFLWAHSSAQGTTVREVFEGLYRRRRIAYTTVMNTMARLAKKRLLRVETRGQAYVYHTNFTPEQFTSRVVSRFLENLLVSFANVPFEALTFPKGSGTQRARLKELLNEIQRRRREERD